MAMHIVAESCNGCGICVTECPNEGIYPEDGVYQIESEYCTECYGISAGPRCSEVCPMGAVEEDPEWPEEEATLAVRAFAITPGLFPRD